MEGYPLYTGEEGHFRVRIGYALIGLSGVFFALGVLIPEAFSFISLLGVPVIAVGAHFVKSGKRLLKGYVGEVRVLEVLSRLDGHVISDVVLPNRRGNIDHVFVSRKGVFAIEEFGHVVLVMAMELEYPSFGKITVDGKTYEHDVVIYPSGRIEKRKKWLSKEKHGTSHKLDPEELGEYLSEDFDVLIVGTGFYGYLSLLPESRELVRGKEVIELPTEKAVELFNELWEKKRVLGIFHVTC